MDILQSVEEYAAAAHEGQRRKFEDEPYITHLIRVKNICQEYSSSTPLLSAALLHDIIEDTSIDKEQLSAFLNTVMDRREAALTLQLVTELTDIFTKANFPELNRRKRKAKEANRLSKISAESQTIKYADILDNSKSLHHSIDGFAQTYLKECQAILKTMDKGNKQLYEIVMRKVESELHRSR